MRGVLARQIRSAIFFSCQLSEKFGETLAAVNSYSERVEILPFGSAPTQLREQVGPSVD